MHEAERCRGPLPGRRDPNRSRLSQGLRARWSGLGLHDQHHSLEPPSGELWRPAALREGDSHALTALRDQFQRLSRAS